MAETPGGERTIAMVSEGFLNEKLQQQMDELIDRALRVRVIINALDAQGLSTPEGTEAYGALWQVDPSGSLARGYAELKVHSTDLDADVMAQAAEGTGGIFIKSNSDFESGLAKMSVPYTMYVLGFSPADLKFDGKFHALEVKLANPGQFTVQARRGYFEPKQGESVETTENETLERAVLRRRHERIAGPVQHRIREGEFEDDEVQRDRAGRYAFHSISEGERAEPRRPDVCGGGFRSGRELRHGREKDDEAARLGRGTEAAQRYGSDDNGCGGCEAGQVPGSGRGAGRQFAGIRIGKREHNHSLEAELERQKPHPLQEWQRVAHR